MKDTFNIKVAVQELSFLFIFSFRRYKVCLNTMATEKVYMSELQYPWWNIK